MVKKTNRDNDDIKEVELSTRLTNKKAKSTYGKKYMHIHIQIALLKIDFIVNPKEYSPHYLGQNME